MTKGTTQVAIRSIAYPLTLDLRKSVLWPAWTLDELIADYDLLPSTIHFGAFLVGDSSGSDLPPLYHPSAAERQLPVGVSTFTLEPFLGKPPPGTLDLGRIKRYVQLHKFAVHPSLRGQGIGRLLFEAGSDAISSPPTPATHLPTPPVSGTGSPVPTRPSAPRMEGTGPTLLHFNARTSQQAVYEKLGTRTLDDELLERYQTFPDGRRETIAYRRMGVVIGSIDQHATMSHPNIPEHVIRPLPLEQAHRLRHTVLLPSTPTPPISDLPPSDHSESLLHLGIFHHTSPTNCLGTISYSPHSPERFLHADVPEKYQVIAREGHAAWIRYLAVLPETQGQGIGKQLIEYVAAESRARGVKLLGLRGVDGAEAFYAKMGFEAIGEAECREIEGRERRFQKMVLIL